MVIGINTGTSSSNPQHRTVLDSKHFFQASDGTHGDELWRSLPLYERKEETRRPRLE
jgi:hypothetical protein